MDWIITVARSVLAGHGSIPIVSERTDKGIEEKTTMMPVTDKITRLSIIVLIEFDERSIP
ncbi:MAG: hypothetical protein Q8L64_04490 [bacterium]|nr:hypothetical protein [bacterium]